MIELLTTTRDETLAFMEGKASFLFRGIKMAEGALGPEVVRDDAFERFVAGDDWFWCAERLIVCRQVGLVVGSACFKNMPQHENGMVEIGYGIAPACRHQGYATAAVAALVKEAFLHPEVKAVTADTSELNAFSAKVLMKNGFVRVGQRYDEEDGAVDEWRLERP